MSSTDPQPRPRQVTMAGLMVVVGSGLSVITGFDVVSTAHSIETREAVGRFLAEQPGGGLGLDVTAATDLLQVSAAVAAVLAAMTTVLGIWAMRRDRTARIGLTVLAVPLFLSGLAMGGLLTSLAAAAVGLLWVSPAREWFAGKPLPPEPERPGRSRRATESQESASSTDVSAGPPTTGPPTTGSATEGPQPAAYPFGTSAPTERPAPQGRPDAVVVAVATTVVVSLIVLASWVWTTVLLASSPELVSQQLTELEQQWPGQVSQQVSQQMVVVSAVVTGVVLSGVALAAIVLALLLLTRRGWARMALLVMSYVTLVASVLASFASLAAVVPAVAAVLVVNCLRRPDVKAWFHAPR